MGADDVRDVIVLVDTLLPLFIGGGGDFEGLAVDVSITGHAVAHGGEAVP